MSLFSRLQAAVQRRQPGDPPFRLASGAESDVYLDVRPVVLDPAGLLFYGYEAADALADVNYELVAGVALGGCPLATGLSMFLVTRPKNDEFFPGRRVPVLYIRKEPKGYGTGKLIEGTYTAGQKVALLEDVITSGQSTIKAIRALREVGLDPVAVLGIIDREQGGMSAIAQEGVTCTALYTMRQVISGEMWK